MLLGSKAGVSLLDTPAAIRHGICVNRIKEMNATMRKTTFAKGPNVLFNTIHHLLAVN
jgi:hypothetical protein